MAYLKTDDLTLYYESHGRGDALLLLHGLGSSSQDWGYQVPAFAEHYQVLCPDLRGHGRSEKVPGPYSMTGFAEDISGLITQINLAPAHILGISLGGMVAFQLALDYPTLVRSLILVNTAPEVVPRNLRDRLTIWQRLLIVRFLGMKRMGHVLGKRFFPEDEQISLRELFVQRWAANHKASYLEALKSIFGWSVTGRLGEISCPTLVVGAEFDYFPLKEKESYTGLIPGARFSVINGARHALPAEKPQEFNDLVLEFLREKI
jgi:pimeloyl-ACP methyl ester carboxylesterase